MTSDQWGGYLKLDPDPVLGEWGSCRLWAVGPYSKS